MNWTAFRGFALLSAVVLAISFSSAGTQGPPQLKETPPQTSAVPSSQLILPDGTPVLLEVKTEVSSKWSHLGDSVQFAVAAPVVVEGLLVLPRLAPALGKVVGVHPARRLNRQGELVVALETAELATGEMAPLRAVSSQLAAGRGATVKRNLKAFAEGALMAPFVWAPAVLTFIGEDKELKLLETLTAYVDGPVVLDRARLQRFEVAMDIGSSPPGADVAIDGVPAGITPWNGKLPYGNHVLTVSKPGFQDVHMVLQPLFQQLKLEVRLEPESQRRQ